MKLVGFSNVDMIVKNEDYLLFDRTDVIVVDINNVLTDGFDFAKFIEIVMSEDGINLGLDKQGVIFYKGQRILYVETSLKSSIQVYKGEEEQGLISTESYICVLDNNKHTSEIGYINRGVTIDDFTGMVQADGLSNFDGGIRTNILE